MSAKEYYEQPYLDSFEAKALVKGLEEDKTFVSNDEFWKDSKP